MKQVEYLNPKNHTVHLVGPDKTQLSIGPHSKIILSEWFQKYAPRYLRVLRIVGEEAAITKVKPQPRIQPIKKQAAFSGVKSGKQAISAQQQPQPVQKPVVPAVVGTLRVISVKGQKTQPKAQHRKAVGRSARGDLNAMYNSAINGVDVSISNNIGVGILSYNRPGPLRRLLDSLIRYTDITRTTIFVSDESSDRQAIDDILKLYSNKITILTNKNRLGVAGNSNRLLKCLDRFAYKFLLNDDVEIISQGWEDFYIKAMNDTKFHHFCFREPGIYGATPGIESVVSGHSVLTVDEKPHGAFMVFDNLAFKTVGYFDENFGLYGMEHVDWSHRVALSKIQPDGFHDVGGSVNYVKIHNTSSSTENKAELLSKARQHYNSVSSNKSRIFVNATPASDVPSISVIIPYRQEDRKDDLVSVVNNMRAMRFPRVEIIISEQDQTTKSDLNTMDPVVHYFTANSFQNQPFCKASAFNKGILSAKNEFCVLQDADIMISCDYLAKVYDLLSEYEGCHIGTKVFYLDESSSQEVNTSGHLMSKYNCERVVGYFEGGSLGCRKSSYIAIGGFNEDYIGYGVEDCDFFERLSTITKFNENRVYNLFHLHHGRTNGWQQCHEANKNIEASLRKKYPSIRDYASYLRKKLSEKYGT